MSINTEFYPLPEPEEPVEAESIIIDVPAFSSPLETEREWSQLYVEPYVEPMQPEMMYIQALETEPVFEAPSLTLPTEEPEPKTETKTIYTKEIVERFTEIPVETVRNVGFFAVLLALLFGLDIDMGQEEMV